MDERKHFCFFATQAETTPMLRVRFLFGSGSVSVTTQIGNPPKNGGLKAGTIMYAPSRKALTQNATAFCLLIIA